MAVIAISDMPAGVRRLDWESAAKPPVATEVWVWGFPGPLAPTEQDEDDIFAATVTGGIVSAHQQSDGVLYLQTDAAINPGNSGGPMIDADGRVVGVSAFRISSFFDPIEGLNFALSVADYRDRVGDLLAGKGPVPAQSVERYRVSYP